MLAGSTTRWKQVVAFHYSGNSTAGRVYKPIIQDIIGRAANIGLHVVCITTDMGSPNQAMWRAFGVDHKETSVPHPSKPDRRLYFMPDVPHLVKNLRSALVSGQPFLIPPETVEKENLPTNEVLVTPLKDLVNFQEGSALKIVPNLFQTILQPSHFDKMKVGPAVTLFGKSTSAGLKYMVAKEDQPHSYLTTAWLLEQVGHWFELMSSRHQVMALSKNNMEEYNKAITFLEDMINLFLGLKIGQPARWKPVQAGVVLATRTVLALQNDMLSQGHAFVLTSRMLSSSKMVRDMPIHDKLYELLPVHTLLPLQNVFSSQGEMWQRRNTGDKLVNAIFDRMGILGILGLILYCFQLASSAFHSLKYSYTAVTPGIEFPEFTAVGTVDDVQFMYYDSNSRKMIPKTEWIKESEGEDYWERETQILMDQQQFFNHSIRITMEYFNLTQGVHTLQNMFGCEWDNDTGSTKRFDQYGYDREDFISLNTQFWDFMALVPEAEFLRQKWNDASHQLEHMKQFLTHECVERLQKYVRYGKSSLERTVPPQVCLLQKDPSSPVTCHVTGFRPRGVMVTWQKDGQELDVDVELGETVPNGDGTFQTRSHLRVKPEDWKRDRYTCTVQHKSLEQDIILTVKEENIRRNMDIILPVTEENITTHVNLDGSGSSTGIIIGCVVGALILFAIGVFMWNRRSSALCLSIPGYRTTSYTVSCSADCDRPVIPA
ncbi:hypothetical protein GJAV_G00105760 [Gymnothorax javanicus]|nr:hypothetical protein GJAV_G00105760 [Gymnothorax javanicus]